MRLAFASFFLLALLGTASVFAQVKVPANSAPVVDIANVLSPSFKARMNASLKNLVQQGGPQIGILVLPDLGGEPIESVSIKVTDQWKLGGAKKDDGVLILVGLTERRMRIEVGQGLEGDLTDVESSRIINEIMKPLFQRGNMEQGLLLASARIAQVTHPEINIEQVFGASKPKVSPSGKSSKSPLFRLIYIIGIFLFLIMLGGGGGRRRRSGFLPGLILGSSIGRGGFGGGGFGGGGGWSGGGGGFSGGGASGGW